MKVLKNKTIQILLSLMLCLFFQVNIVFAEISGAADMHYQKGLSLYEQGKFKEAEAEFQKAIDKTKKNKEAYYQNGVRYYDLGKYKKAEAEFKKALEATEEENDQHYKKGLILYNQGEFAEAEKEFKLAISDMKKDEVSAATAENMKHIEQPVSGDDSLIYRINVGDILNIKVWQNDDLNDQVTVRPDGFISFPLVGEIRVSNKTITEFREELTRGLREYIKYPQVSVSIDNFGGNRIVVLGQVRSPGVYTVPNGKTVIEAIGLAGGFTEDAVTASVIIVEGGLAKPEPKRLDLNKALKNADLADNKVLQPQDMIYVPRRFVKDLNYFLKAFLDPIASGMYIRREYKDF